MSVRYSTVSSRWWRTNGRIKRRRSPPEKRCSLRDAVGHNHFWFRRYAIERALLLEDWNEADRQADALLVRMAAEPLAYASIVAERGRYLVRRGLGETTDMDEEKFRLLSEATAEIDLRIDALGSALRQI